jgi:hypothetical protein
MSTINSDSVKYQATDYITSDLSTNIMLDKNTAYETLMSEKKTYLGSLWAYMAYLYDDSDYSSASAPDATDLTSAATAFSTAATANTYTASDASIKSVNQSLLNQRNKMDVSISMMNKPNNLNSSNDFTILYNAHFYISILWTILATCLIYYIFTEI